ncbi:hypothetical protein SAMN04487969_104181 [Paenibacillus algorifonticola]|uniref:Uncharacterized protein n=1 Tax=Paenibacillus algorifonticola TaxID=684063 RepID=A0A1I2C077_9BACL|nr:hypothetical protein SAMN04487969_104181 [Paenibacillus algorifonticola]
MWWCLFRSGVLLFGVCVVAAVLLLVLFRSAAGLFLLPCCACSCLSLLPTVGVFVFCLMFCCVLIRSRGDVDLLCLVVCYSLFFFLFGLGFLRSVVLFFLVGTMLRGCEFSRLFALFHVLSFFFQFFCALLWWLESQLLFVRVRDLGLRVVRSVWWH